jgi:hypothetical protein
MIQGVYVYRKGGEVIGSPFPAFDDLFLQIDSDNTSAGLYFVVDFVNEYSGKKVTIKLYPKIGQNTVETYISQILRNLFNNIFFYYRLKITVKEYDESGYVNNLIMSFIVIPSIYNSFLPPLKNYYFYYYDSADYDILSSRGITLYDDDFNELSDEISIMTTLNNIYKETLDPPFKKIITITHKQVCEPLLKLKYLNLHTGYYDTFGGWYLKQDTVNIEKQIYNRQTLMDTGTRQALPELDNEFTLISYDLPVDQANYIAKSIIMSPKTFLIDTNGNEMECVVMNKNYTDALSVVNVFANINLNIRL